MPKRLIFLLAVTLAISLVAPDPLEAQTKNKKQQARASFKAGQQQFKEKEYGEALKLFQKANKLHPHPDILFMVAQCHRNLKQYSAAVKSFKGYLEAKPAAEDKAQVKRLIEELEFLQEVDPVEPTEPVEPDEPGEPDDPDQPDKPAVTPPVNPLVRPTPPRVPRAPTPRLGTTPVYKKWWFWAVVGGTLAVAGGVGGIIAYSAGGEEAPAGSLGTLDLR